MYAFILGNHPEISIAELGSFFGDKVSINPVNKIAFTECELPSQFTNAGDFLKILGGTITIMKVLNERVGSKELTEVVAEHVKGAMGDTTSKFPFSIDVHPESNATTPYIKQFTIGVKKHLTKEGKRSEFWNNNFRNINRVFAVKNHLLEKGIAFALLPRGNSEFMVCQLVALQDVEDYADRDYGKAERDNKSGMLPPKLAQIMMNLAIFNRAYGVTFDESRRARVTVLDPFCGSGTVLMEALLRGFSTFGSDISEKAVEQSKTNVDWLRQARTISPAAGAMVLHKSALELSKKDCELACPDITGIAVVSEPFLGPPMREEPSDAVLDKVMYELSDLYVGFFKNMSKWLPAETPIVCVFPCWRRAGGGIAKLSSRVVEKITSLGYSVPAYSPQNSTSLIYSRPYTVVAREILRFVKK